MTTMIKKQIASNDVSRKRLWLPFTNMVEFHDFPFVINRAEGVYVFDENDNQYLDCISSLWHVSNGHNNPFYIERLTKQLQSGLTSGALFGVMHVKAIEYANKLIEFINTDSLDVVFLSNDGSEAVETAIKIALKYKELENFPDTYIMFMSGSYHGVTLGALSAMGIDGDRKGFEEHLSKKFVRIENPFFFQLNDNRSDNEKLNQFERMFEAIVSENQGKLGAFILEPIMGAGGIVVPPTGFLKRVRQLCNKHNMLLILDEVVTGFWRSGHKFAFFEEKCTPDILVLSKGIGGGYLPLGATVVGRVIYETLNQRLEAFMHGHTYGGNPLSCAAGLAHLDFIDRLQYQESVLETVKLFSIFLQGIRHHPSLKNMRYKGLMAGLELREEVGRSVAMSQQALITTIGKKHGLLLRPLGNVITLLPMMTITKDQLKELFDRLLPVLDELLTL